MSTYNRERMCGVNVSTLFGLVVILYQVITPGTFNAERLTIMSSLPLTIRQVSAGLLALGTHTYVQNLNFKTSY